MKLIFDFPTSLCGVLVLRFAPAAPATPSAAAPPRLSLSHLTPHMALTPTHTPSFTTQLCHTPSLTHHLSHTVTDHFSHTIFHIPLCHTPSLTHHLSHTTLRHHLSDVLPPFLRLVLASHIQLITQHSVLASHIQLLTQHSAHSHTNSSHST